MANMMDYLDWRGDLTFQQSPFNEVDSLLLTELAYVDFTDIVPGEPGSGKLPEQKMAAAVFLKDASHMFWDQHEEQEVLAHVSMTKMAPFVMKKMAQTRRFGNACLSRFVKDISIEEQSQFSAVCILLDDGSLFVSYSGTDSTIIGWRENFNMSYLEHTPAQEKAVAYLNRSVVDAYHTVRIGGHSKGGNLAVYAAAYCEEKIRDKVVRIYSNDGPGFEGEVLGLPSYQQLRTRIKRVLPQQAIVGMLLSHRVDYEVVRSTENHVKQHDMLSWEVLGTQLIYEDKLSNKSVAIDEILKTWIAAMDLPQRKQFIETVFFMLERAGVESVDDLYHMKWKSVSELIRSQRELTEQDKDILSKTWKLLIGAGNTKIRKMVTMSGPSREQ